jgi:ammonium transporter, Amt family
MISYKRVLPVLAAAVLAPLPALADTNSGDTAWLLTAAAFVLLMTPGLAFFYAGMVARKNAVSTLYQNMIAIAVIGLVWIVAGYSLAFSAGSPWIGDMSFKLLAGVGQEPSTVYATTVPHQVFMLYQMMFAIITPALITGAFAERVRFGAWILFMVLWSLLVYVPICHWVWTPGGYLTSIGALDFAGGFVVHMSAGFSALVAAIVFGKRSEFGKPAKPYDVGMVVLGTALLWFGWFGFNAGSAVAANGLAGQAFLNTFIASAMAMLLWTLVDKVKDGKPTTMGGCIGVVAGLVAITPAAGFVESNSAFIIGGAAGVLCNLVARIVKSKFKLDDTLDVFACHGIGGLIGVISTGLFATVAVNSAGANGLLNGGDRLFTANLTGAAIVAGYSVVVTFVLLKVINLFCKIRVSAADEAAGLDSSQHGEVIKN